MLAGREWIGKELSWYPDLSKPLQAEEIHRLMQANSATEWKATIDPLGRARPPDSSGDLPRLWVR